MDCKWDVETVVVLYSKQKMAPLTAHKEIAFFCNQINLTKLSECHQLHLMSGHLPCAEHNFSKALYRHRTNPAMLGRQAHVTQQGNASVPSDSRLLLPKLFEVRPFMLWMRGGHIVSASLKGNLPQTLTMWLLVNIWALFLCWKDKY